MLRHPATLVLIVSPDARGTFTLELDFDVNETLVAGPMGYGIQPLTLKPGAITIEEDK